MRNKYYHPYYHPKLKQFIRLWIDKNKHHMTNNYRKAHGLPKWSKEVERHIYIKAFLECYRDYMKEIGE